MSLVTELKRRNVFKVGIAYAVVAWLVLQVADIVFDAIGTPDWVMQTLLFVLALGGVIALFFAWAFELTPEGLKREKDVDRSQSIAPQTGRKLDFAIIGLLVLALGYFVYESRFMARGGDPVAGSLIESPAEAMGVEVAEVAAIEPGTDPMSIAVLPFANRSLLEEDLFFTDGIHDDLLTQLAKINGLKVISRTSVLQYKDTQKPIPEIAKELRVATILEGGVQRAGDRVRINAQLIDVTHDQHLWAETFDREMSVENIFDIQSEITRQIVQAVRGEMSEDERQDVERIPTDNLEAYEAYLKALSLINSTDYRMENYIDGEFWARRAVELDPSFTEAWTMLVETNGQAVWIGYDASPERRERARKARDTALRLDPDLPETLAAVAEYQYRIEQNFEDASASYRRAHEARPGDVKLLFRLGVAQRRTHDLEGALDSFRRALELDPNHARSATLMIEMLGQTGRTEEAERLARTWMVRRPDVQDIRAYYVEALIREGRIEDARLELDKITPTSIGTYINVAADLPFLERDYDAVIAMWGSPVLDRALENRGTAAVDFLCRAWAYRLKGQDETAVAEAREGIARLQSLSPMEFNGYAFELATLGELMALAGDPEGALQAIERSSELLPVTRDFYFGSLIDHAIVRTLALVGERERALAEIGRLLDAPYKLSRWRLHLDPRWDFFRDDERFNALATPEGAKEAGP